MYGTTRLPANRDCAEFLSNIPMPANISYIGVTGYRRHDEMFYVSSFVDHVVLFLTTVV